MNSFPPLYHLCPTTLFLLRCFLSLPSFLSSMVGHIIHSNLRICYWEPHMSEDKWHLFFWIWVTSLFFQFNTFMCLFNNLFLYFCTHDFLVFFNCGCNFFQFNIIFYWFYIDSIKNTSLSHCVSHPSNTSFLRVVVGASVCHTIYPLVQSILHANVHYNEPLFQLKASGIWFTIMTGSSLELLWDILWPP